MPEPKSPSLLERYGSAFIVSLLGVLALQMVVLTPMVRWGVNLGPLVAWIGSTFGTTIELPGQQLSWPLSAALAYAITRPLKVITLPLVAAITPLVARWVMPSGVISEVDPTDLP